MKHRRQAVDARWAVISNSDLRRRQTQLDRPFGSAAWRPKDDDNERIAKRLVKIRDHERDMALAQKRDWLGLGVRQYCYRLKARGFIFADATQLGKEHFVRVERILSRMRRAGLIDWRDVTDGRGIEHVPFAFRDNGARITTLARFAKQMSHERMSDQRVVPELAVETEGLYNLIYDLADRYGAQSRGLQGQSSIGARYELAQRVAQRWMKRARTRVLCVADYDKHGDEILGAIAADTAQHLRDMQIAPDDCLQVVRVALTQAQIDEHGIPTAEKDGRLVQEAEALPTDVLRAEVEAALRDTLDMTLFERVARKKQREIDALVRALKKLRASCLK
jgi:hypothetical protein